MIAMLPSLSSYRSHNDLGDVHHFQMVPSFFRSLGEVVLAPGAGGDQHFCAYVSHFFQSVLCREGGQLWEGLFCSAACPTTEGILPCSGHLHKSEARDGVQDISRLRVQSLCTPPSLEAWTDRTHPSPFTFPGCPGVRKSADATRIVIGQPCLHRLDQL